MQQDNRPVMPIPARGHEYSFRRDRTTDFIVENVLRVDRKRRGVK
jgi:hypothetical protein